MSRVAVCMPAYNVGRYIRESIQSVIDQSFGDWQLIVHDDCSNDNTFDCALMFDDTRVSAYRRQEHCGLIGKMNNETISMFSGQPDYICQMDSDDIISPDCFRIFVDYMDAHPEVGVCCGNFMCFDDTGRLWSLPHAANSGEYDSATLLRYMNMFPHRMFRKSVFDRIGGYSNELLSSEDYDLALKLDEVTKVHRIKDPITYYYRQHPRQVSSRLRKQQDLDAKRALETALKRRGINKIVTNDAPPFVIATPQPTGAQFIWGKK